MAKAPVATPPAPPAPPTASSTLQSQFGYINGQDEGRQLLRLPVSHLTVEKHQLRGAQRDDLEYEMMRDSIKKVGVLETILVREAPDLIEDDGEMRYRVIDGTQRFSCAQDVGHLTIPCHVINMTDAEVADAQIIANRNNLETKPYEYTEQLHRMLLANPTLTVPELAEKLHCPTTFLEARLGLRKLKPEIGQLLDDGKIVVSNALHLAKCDHEAQERYAEEAMTMKVQEFGGLIQNHLNELKAARREGRAPKKDGFEPVARLRKPKDLKPYLQDPAGNRMKAEQILAAQNVTTPIDAFFATLNWVFHLDPEAIEEAKAKEAAKKQQKAAESTALAAEKARIRANEAREAARKAGLLPQDEVATMPEPDDDDDEDDEDDEDE